MAVAAAAAAPCSREVPSAVDLCAAIDASSFACGVLYTGTLDASVAAPTQVTCPITHSINVTCSAAAPPLACAAMVCFYGDNVNETVTVQVQGCTMTGKAFSIKMENASITLRGVVMDGMSRVRPLTVENARSVWLEDVQVLKGKNSEKPGGGCIFLNTTSDITLRRVSVRGCYTSVSIGSIGGSVVVTSRVIVLEDVLISNGKSDTLTGGGCLAAWGYCLKSISSSFYISDLYDSVVTSTLTITNSSFVDCYGCSGAGISVYRFTQTTLDYVMVRNGVNKLDSLGYATGSGGCLDAAYDTNDFVNTSLTITNSLFTFCSSGNQGAGGGVSVYRIANVMLENVTVSNAMAPGYGGGCMSVRVYSDFTNNITNSTLTVTNSVFRNCTAKGQGGGILLGRILSVVLVNVSVQNATAATLGGCLLTLGIENYPIGSLTVTDSVFADCEAKGEGGGLMLTAILATTLSNVIVRNCTAALYGGCMRHHGYQPGLVTSPDYGELTIVSSDFSECKASVGSGGGLSTFAVRTINLTNMTVRKAVANGFGALAFGGCVSVENTTKIAVSNSAFSECKANTEGGGLYLGGIRLATLENISICNAVAVTGSGGCVRGSFIRTLGVLGTSLSECSAAI